MPRPRRATPSQFIGSGRNRVFVRELGVPGGTPVILLHGYRRCGLTFLPQMEALARDFHLIIPDLPGHGETPARRRFPEMGDLVGAVRAVYRRFGLEKADLVGHSMGGVLAARYAIENPGSVRSLVFLESLPLVATWRQPDKVRPSLDNTLSRRVDRYIVKRNSMQHAEEACVALRKDLGMQNVIRVFSMPELRILLILNRCKRNPAAYYRRKIAEELRSKGYQGVPNYELAMIDECGHFAHWTATKRVNGRIAEFLKRGKDRT